MADIMTKGTLFSPEVTKEIFNKVKGKSSLAKLSAETPIPFNGTDVFTFTLDKEAALVAESGVKGVGGMDLAPVRIAPVKIEYGARVTDEFLYATEEKQLDILTEYTNGCAKKFARALDIMAMHGLNPRTLTESDLVASKSFDKTVTGNIVNATTDPVADILDAITLLDDADVNGIAMANGFKTSIAKLKNATGGYLYPEVGFGSDMSSFNGLSADANSTVAVGTTKDLAIVGDFANAFKWGYAKDMNFEVIAYGDPDNSGKDLKAYNQVYLRCEAYVGFGILDASSFAVIRTAE